MAEQYLHTYLTPDVLDAQATAYGRTLRVPGHETPDRLGPDEAAFIAARDSFYMASVNSDGWPYIQHRGGPKGFLRVLDEGTLGFADLGGNRQLISTGNLAANPRVALFLMDYPRRARLKIAGEARVLEARGNADLVDRLAPSPALRPKVERLFLIDVRGFDWNCSQHISPRFTAGEVEAYAAELKARIAELEAKLEGRP